MAGENGWTALLEGWWAKIKAAFMRSIRGIIDFAQIGRIAEHFEKETRLASGWNATQSRHQHHMLL